MATQVHNMLPLLHVLHACQFVLAVLTLQDHYRQSHCTTYCVITMDRVSIHECSLTCVAVLDEARAKHVERQYVVLASRQVHVAS